MANVFLYITLLLASLTMAEAGSVYEAEDLNKIVWSNSFIVDDTDTLDSDFDVLPLIFVDHNFRRNNASSITYPWLSLTPVSRSARQLFIRAPPRMVFNFA
jgi:hypothetical protein